MENKEYSFEASRAIENLLMNSADSFKELTMALT